MGTKHSRSSNSDETPSKKHRSKNGIESNDKRPHGKKQKNASDKLLVPENNNGYMKIDSYLLNGYSVTNSWNHDNIHSMTLSNNITGNPRAISPLQLDATFETSSRFHFKIFDPNNKRFEVSLELSLAVQPSEFKRRSQETDYEVEYNNNPFRIVVTRRSTGQILFDSCGGFLFEDECITLRTAVHTRYLYGLGEHQKRFLIDTCTHHNFTFWARDQPPKGETNLYGVHPFFLGLEEDGNAFGVFLLNSCAMEMKIQPGPPASLTYAVNGGLLDFYIFTGPTPINVVQQYQELIGRPHLPPYWALGYHLSRYGYNSIEEFRDVINRTRLTQMPYESQFSDIDMLDEKQSWTYKDAELIDIVADLHRNGQRVVPIVDPGVSLKHDKSPAYTDGIKSDIFIKNYTGARPLVGKVWPGECVFPDFSHPDVYVYWFKQAQSLYENIPFDGLWLDMNEPANFGAGCVEVCNMTSSHPKDFPAFVPGSLAGEHLFDKTICPSAKQYLGLHYELHNLYGHMQLKVTDSVLRKLRGRRSLLLSRSTFAGSGRYGGHWTGDNNSSFEDLRMSISAILDFNLFGIPLVGADVGGFFRKCSEELMIRWTQLGAFYPFMRNHNNEPEDGWKQDQDPAVYSQEAQQIMADIVCVRYSLLPYLYTLLFENHSKGSPVIRPLFMLYPRDKKTYSIDDQFMWGNSLLISPCVYEGQRVMEAYFPFDVWYDFYTGHRLTKVGSDIQLAAPLEHINIHVRGGSILLTQTPARNTTYSRRNPFGLLAALDSNHLARGKLYWDDGDTLDPYETKQYNLIKFHINKNRLTTTFDLLGHRESSMRLRLVQIFGLYVKPDRVIVNGEATSFAYDESQAHFPMFGEWANPGGIAIPGQPVARPKQASAPHLAPKIRLIS